MRARAQAASLARSALSAAVGARGFPPRRGGRRTCSRSAGSGRGHVTVQHWRRQHRWRRKEPSPASSRRPRQVRGPVRGEAGNGNARGEHRRGRASGTNGANDHRRRNHRAPSIAVARNGRRRAQRAAGQASARSTRSVRRREGSQRYRRAAAIGAESPVAKRRARTFRTGILMTVEQARRRRRKCCLHPDRRRRHRVHHRHRREVRHHGRRNQHGRRCRHHRCERRASALGFRLLHSLVPGKSGGAAAERGAAGARATRRRTPVLVPSSRSEQNERGRAG